MIDSVPLMAPMSPPLTGASSMVAPSVLRARGEPSGDAGRDAAHVDDDRSGCSALNTPSGPFEHALDVR